MPPQYDQKDIRAGRAGLWFGVAVGVRTISRLPPKWPAGTFRKTEKYVKALRRSSRCQVHNIRGLMISAVPSFT